MTEYVDFWCFKCDKRCRMGLRNFTAGVLYIKCPFEDEEIEMKSIECT